MKDLFGEEEEGGGAAPVPGWAGAVVGVLVAALPGRVYDYAVPEGMACAPGDYVRVPLAGREVPGVVWSAAQGGISRKLKEIAARYDLPPMLAAHRAFIDRAADYTVSPPGMILKMALSVPAALEPEEAGRGYAISRAGREVFLSTPHPEGSAFLPSPLGEGGGDNGDVPSLPPHRGERVGWGEMSSLRRTKKEQLIPFAREMRRSPTNAEKTLWHRINREQTGHKFRRQHPVPPYVADFACVEAGLIVEVDGGQHDEDRARDARRTAFLESQGFRVLRFWNNEVMENVEGVLSIISGALENALDSPHRTLPPHRGGREGERYPDPPPSMRGEGRKAEPSGWGEKDRKILSALSDGVPRRAAEIARVAGCSAATVRTLIKKGLLEEVPIRTPAPCAAPDPERGGPVLSADQGAVAGALCADVQAGAFRASLLDGVTGSGKTEVYFEAVAQAVRQGRQALVLLPEIALSNAFIGRFEARFGCAPALWHSALAPGRRRTTWRGVARGETKVVVGARSALFLPYADLGLIVVDEEHDSAFKQEEGVFYNARDMAVLRAHLGGFPVVLVSATPSLESAHNAWSGRYAHLSLPDRHGGAQLPCVHILDLRADRPESQRFIAPTLRRAVAATLAAGEQALLFLNRRGYAPLTICRACGHRMECPRCTAWLVEHRARGRLECHHCGLAMRIPEICPACGEPESFAPCGPGVERIAEEIAEYFPDARAMVLASDTAESPDALRVALEDIRERRTDIVIGTQIVAKGHHFPGLTCVGVIDADLGLAGGELRATERTYQLLHQVAGRAGREDLPGHVYLQTWNPESRVIQALAAGDRDEFLNVELAERESAGMPPFTRLAGIIVSGVSESETDAAAGALGRAAPQGEGIRTLGPAAAPMARLRGRHRRRLLVVADKGLNLQKAVREWIGAAKLPPSIRVQIDIDPQSFG